MARVYTTGPAYVWVRPTNSTTPFFLGTTEHGVKVAKQKVYIPLFNDMGGEVEFDKGYGGQRAFFQMIFTRWSEILLGTIEQNFLAQRGIDDAGDIGALMLAEGKYFEAWVQFPFAFPSGFPETKIAYGDLPLGYHLPAAILDGPPIELTAGTQPLKTGVVFQSLRKYFPLTRQFVCYDHDMSALPGPAGID